MDVEARPVVDTGWLSERLGDANIVPVDVRPPHFYAEAHLPRAVNLPAFFLFGPNSAPPEPEALASRLSTLGINRETHVVAYDEGGSPSAARLYWVLRYFGHPNVSVLDGGITKWRHEGLDWEYEPRPISPDYYEIGDADPTLIAQLEDVKSSIDNSGTSIIDTRTPAEYLGLQMTARQNGHIPGAINIDWTNNLAMPPEGVAVMADDEELRRLYLDAGVEPEKQVIVYCQSGNRAAATFLALKHLGYPRVALYPAGWQEWGNRTDTPAEE